MLRRWLGGRTQQQSPTPNIATHSSTVVNDPSAVVVTTDDPLAAIDPGSQIYSVSRSVVLPRVALRNNNNNGSNGATTSATGTSLTNGAVIAVNGGGGTGVNPIFAHHLNCTTTSHKPNQLKHPPASVHHAHETKSTLLPSSIASQHSRPISGSAKTPSSGYGSHGGSSHDPTYLDAVAVLEQNANFVKQILVAVKNGNKSRRSVGSLGSSAAGTLTLTTIPEGKVDFSIPRPVWPPHDNKKQTENFYDSLIDESVLLYTSLSYVPEENDNTNNNNNKVVSASEVLKELSDTINAAVDGKIGLSPEQVLKCISDRLSCDMKVLQQSTEEDMRKLSINLSNSERLNTVIRAFSNSSSSGNSSQSDKCSAMDAEDIYQVPSGCSSSGFTSGSSAASRNRLPVFIHEDLSSVPNGLRNALIYGTLCRSGTIARASSGSSGASSTGNSANERLLGRNSNNQKGIISPTKLLVAEPDAKPSVWEIYYGAGVVEGDVRMKKKLSDTPYFPAGRPEADFTLDIPRSELLTRRMRAAKKWRFRCRIVTSFLGLVFFLLSLMAVSLMLTRGKRMFGSMV